MEVESENFSFEMKYCRKITNNLLTIYGKQIVCVYFERGFILVFIYVVFVVVDIIT